jgi:hypothetical protein
MAVVDEATIFEDAGFKQGCMLRIFVGEDAQHGVGPVYDAVVQFLRRENISGASVFRGVEGFGSHHELHLNRIFTFNAKMPILIEAVDTMERITALLPRIEVIVADGLITLERISYRRYVRGHR